MNSGKTAHSIKIPFRTVGWVGPKNYHVLYGSPAPHGMGKFLGVGKEYR